jgi:hypothetical protein
MRNLSYGPHAGHITGRAAVRIRSSSGTPCGLNSLARAGQANDNLKANPLAYDELSGPCTRCRGHKINRQGATCVWRQGFAARVCLAKVSAYCDAIYRARRRACSAERHVLRRASSPDTLIPETQLQRRNSK